MLRGPFYLFTIAALGFSLAVAKPSKKPKAPKPPAGPVYPNGEKDLCPTPEATEGFAQQVQAQLSSDNWQNPPDPKTCAKMPSIAELTNRGCVLEYVPQPPPFYTVISKATQEKDMKSNEVKTGSRITFYSDICRNFIPSKDPNKTLYPEKCSKTQVLPRGSIVRMISDSLTPPPWDPKGPATFAEVRIQNVETRYNSALTPGKKNSSDPKEATTLYQPLNGDEGRIQWPNLKPILQSHSTVVFRNRPADSPLPEAMRIEYNSLAGGYGRYHCPKTIAVDEEYFLAFKGVDPVSGTTQSQAYAYSYACFGSGPTAAMDILDESTTKTAYALLKQINSLLSAPSQLSIQALEFNDEGLVHIPFDPYDPSKTRLRAPEDPDNRKPEEIADLEGVARDELFATYNSGAFERSKKVDRWATPEAMCSAFVLAKEWRKRCAGEVLPSMKTDFKRKTPYDPRFCLPQLGDFAFHSKTTSSDKGSTAALQKQLGIDLSKDPCSHRSHDSGRCVDFRIFSPTSYLKGVAQSSEDLALTNAFIKTARELGAVDIFYAKADAENMQYVRPMGHFDHIHMCFPHPQERGGLFASQIPDFKSGKTEFPKIQQAPPHPLIDGCYTLR